MEGNVMLSAVVSKTKMLICICILTNSLVLIHKSWIHACRQDLA